MSHFLIVGPDDSNSRMLQRVLPGRVVHLDSLAGRRATHILSDASVVVLNFAEAVVSARVVQALRRAEPDIRVFAIARNWSADNQEEVLDAGADGCLAAPLDPDVVRHVLSQPNDSPHPELNPSGEIQYRHGYPGRHLGSLEQPGF
ncbi:MAG: hypothetical protein SGI92_26990 [Bryobacteraceae bacterium]|nr:hypothetical protein [Bryobacteraceae bacterium]